MAYGLLSGFAGLPPGLRGYVAAEQLAGQRGSNAINQASGLLSLQNLAQQQAFAQQMQPIQVQLAQAQLHNSLNPAPSRIDLGGEYGLIDRAGNIIGRIPKTATPDARLKANMPTLQQLPVAGQPGVTQPTWLKPGETAGIPVGGMKMPDILNPAVQAARSSVAAAGRPVISVSTEKKYGEQFASAVAQADVAMRDAAIKAPALADRSNRILSTLATNPITGTAADFRLEFAKAAKLAGLTDSDAPENTEILAASLAQNTLDAIKASGLGSGTGFSNADRDFLEKAVGGKITMQPKSLATLAELSHRAAVLSVNRWNNRVKEIPKDALAGTGVSAEPISISPLYQPRRRSTDSGSAPNAIKRYNPQTGAIE